MTAVPRDAPRLPRERGLVRELVHLGAAVARQALGAIENDDVGRAGDAALQLARHLFQPRPIIRRHVRDEARGADALAAEPGGFGGEKLDGLLRLRIARAVGVVVVEEPAADVRAGAANLRQRGGVVLIRQHEEELRVCEIGRRVGLTVRAHCCVRLPIGRGTQRKAAR